MISNIEAMTEAIKNMEPALRVQGKAPDWGKFRMQFEIGQYSEASTLQNAIDMSAGDKVDFKDESSGSKT